MTACVAQLYAGAMNPMDLSPFVVLRRVGRSDRCHGATAP